MVDRKPIRRICFSITTSCQMWLSASQFWLPISGCVAVGVYMISTGKTVSQNFNWSVWYPYNAVLRDSLASSWWRQEAGEAAKGVRQGDQLEDIYFEQMTLKNWLAKHPKSLILQYALLFMPKYNFLGKLPNYEASFLGWHMQKPPPMVVGIEIDGQAKAYDLNMLQKNTMVQGEVAVQPALVVRGGGNHSSFAYSCTLEKTVLTFVLEKGKTTDTGSVWSHLGEYTECQHKGKKLTQLQSYQQFIWAWIIFHPDTKFYEFT